MKIRLIIICLILVGASAFISRTSRPEIVPIRESLSGLPMQIGTWTGQEAPAMDSRVMAVLGVDDYVDRIYYSSDSTPLSLYIGYYESQRQGDTIHSPLNCLPGAGWNPVRSGRIKIAVDGNSAIEINRIIIMKGMDKQVVLYWYQSHGRIIASEYWGKIYTVIDALRTNRTDAALVRVVCPVLGSEGRLETIAEECAIDFVKTIFPILARFLPS